MAGWYDRMRAKRAIEATKRGAMLFSDEPPEEPKPKVRIVGATRPFWWDEERDGKVVPERQRTKPRQEEQPKAVSPKPQGPQVMDLGAELAKAVEDETKKGV